MSSIKFGSISGQSDVTLTIKSGLNFSPIYKIYLKHCLWNLEKRYSFFFSYINNLVNLFSCVVDSIISDAFFTFLND